MNRRISKLVNKYASISGIGERKIKKTYYNADKVGKSAARKLMNDVIEGRRQLIPVPETVDINTSINKVKKYHV